MSRDGDTRNWSQITLDAGARRAAKGELLSTELAVREATPVPASPGLFGTDKPDAIIKRAATVAGLLKDVVDKQGLIKNIGGKQYILAEGWTTLGAMVGVFPKVEYSKPVLDPDGNKIGWEAAVEVVNAQGVVIGRAEAECLRDERNWKSRDDFALRSMAQTRAMGKALRMPLGFIAAFAGYEATPAEEMPEEDSVPFEAGPGDGTRRKKTVKAGAEPLQPFEPGVGRAAGSKTGAVEEKAASRAAGEEVHAVSADAAGVDGASTFAPEPDITEFLDLAASVSAEDHDKAVSWLVKERDKNGGSVPAARLKAASKRLLAKVPA